MYKSIVTLFMLFAFGVVSLAQNEMRTNVSTFETIPLNSKGIYNGSDLQGGFWNGHFYYHNSYDTAWKTWSGFAVSNNKDTVKNDYTNEYSSITGGGINGTKHFTVCFLNGSILLENSSLLSGFYVTNTTYTYKTIKEGSSFSKKFGGSSGNDKDWFRITIVSFLKGTKLDSTAFYLADFRSDDNSKDYILNKWSWVDLTNFKKMDSLSINFESSDVGQFGMNTPAYVAIDDFNPVPPSNFNMYPGLFFDHTQFFNQGNVWNGSQDTSGGFVYGALYFENEFNTQWNSFSGWAVSKNTDTTKSGLEAQYTSVNGKGAGKMHGNDPGYAVSYGRSVIRLPYKKGGWPITDFRFSYANDLYPYKSMKNGDAFSKKFGGLLGTDPDYFRLFVIGYDDNNIPVDTLGLDDMNDEMTLADFRMNRQYLGDNWNSRWLGGFKKNIVRMEFQLESTDNGQFGMNTPAYFCLDNFFEYPVVSFNENESKLGFKIYPNPASNYIMADLQNSESYEIMDLNGRAFVTNANPNSNKIDISQLPSGMYCLRVNANETVYCARFIKL